MSFNWRKWNRILHRDFGYLFAGMTVIYGISGIALNHIDEWNPNYIINRQEVNIPAPLEPAGLDREKVIDILESIGEEDNFKNYYFPDAGSIKIFVRGGSMVINLGTGKGVMETIRRRPLFHEVNFLHYNPGRLWTWVSDLFAFALILLAISGLFIIRGSKGITGRGAWLTLAGILVPLAFLLIYL